MSVEKTREAIRLKVGERIRNSREKISANGRDFAKMLGTSYQQVYRWENGKTVPSIFSIIQIAELTNVSANYLLNVFPSEDPEPHRHRGQGGIPLAGQQPMLFS